LSSALLSANPASAQDQLEEVMVTGSRIVRSGMQTPTPVTAVSSQELSSIDPGNLVDALSQLPQFLNNTTATDRGNFLGAAGSAYPNVRGLGTNRTLTLLDGHRMPPVDRESSVDTNLFPEALVSRVEVVTGGASAAYGADALSGVVNFILNTQYEGFEARVQGGQTNYNDGDNWEASFTGGLPIGDRMHLTFSAEGFSQDQVAGEIAGLDNRDWYQDYGYVTNPAWSPGAPPGIARLLMLPHVHSSDFTAGGKIDQPGFSFDQYTFIGDGTQTRLFQPGPIADSNSSSGGPEYEIARLSTRQILGTEVQRTNAFLNIDFDVGDDTTVFARYMRGENEAYRRDISGFLAYSFRSIWHGTIFRENAYLPENIRQAMVDEGLTEMQFQKEGQLVGPTHHNWADHYSDGTEITQDIFSAGFDTRLANGWTLTGYVHYGKSEKNALLDNILRVDREFMAMDAVEVYPDRRDLDGDGLPDLVAPADRGTGEIVCNVQRYNPTNEELAASVAGVTVPSPSGPVGIASPVGLDGSIENCVPLNVFGWGNASEAAQAYVVSDKSAQSEVSQKFAEVVASGDVADNWYAGALSFSLGATYRAEDMSQVELPRDIAALGPPQNAPDLGIRGFPGGYTFGSPNLNAFSNLATFGGDFDVYELFGEALVPLYNSSTSSRHLNLNVAARRSKYSRAGTLDTWKVGLDAQLTESLRLRGTLSRDAREATFAEQFDFNGGGGTVEDPMFDNEDIFVTVNTGGNPDLKPEQADTTVFGFVYQPQFAPGLSFSADYYDIDLSETIGTLGTQRIVDDCYFDNVEQACSLIDRDPQSGHLTRVANILVNIDNARVRGTDMELTYSMQPNLFPASESLSFRLLAGFLAENSTTPRGGDRFDEAGATSLPKLTTTAFLNYRVGPWTAYVQHRFIDETKRSASWVEGVDIYDNTIASVNYTNLGLRYTRDSTDIGWEIYLNVQNAFDAHPPAMPGTGLPQHQPIALGRRYVLGAQFDF
jgi:iron complex outermembrane receptor protein